MEEAAMLVISRRPDEVIVIGNEIEVMIVDVRGNKVRLGITAPKHIPIHRREVQDRINRGEPRRPKAKGGEAA